MNTYTPRPAYILPIIVLAQFAGTSLWFAANAVLGDLTVELGWHADALGTLTSSVQLGFIAGTLTFAILSLADRMAPGVLFLICALMGAATNAAAMLGIESLAAWVGLRFATGFFLAGIYPVGMKIAASWFEKGLGKALGLLVGALVLGTAFPHLLRALGGGLPWRAVLGAVSIVAALGGVLLFALVPTGPHLPPPSKAGWDAGALKRVFRDRDFRAAALGYFGHMWELYAFWTLVPIVLGTLDGSWDVSLWSFIIIAIGAVGCVVGGLLALRVGSARVAYVQLAVSGLCCLLAPLLLMAPNTAIIVVLCFWGIAVVGDSPQLSTLNAQTAPRELVGTALTIVTSIGFFITVPSIQLSTWISQSWSPGWALFLLAPGPILGLFALRSVARKRSEP